MYCNRSLKQNEEIEDGEAKKLCPEYTEKIRTVKVSVNRIRGKFVWSSEWIAPTAPFKFRSVLLHQQLRR